MQSTATAADVQLVPADLLAEIADSAKALDTGKDSARRAFPALGDAGLLDLGAPHNTDGELTHMVRALSQVSNQCLSTAFSMWATRMTLEYLLAADTEYARSWAPKLRAGEVLGVTAMASAFRDLAGCGSLELTAVPDGDGYLVSGPIRWASNLYADSLMVTAARTDRGDKIIVALPLATEGITVGQPFSLLALGSTASSFMTLDNVRVGGDQVLTHDFDGFLAGVRPTFLVLQTALCVGLAETSLDQAQTGLVGVNSVFASEVDALGGRLSVVRSALASAASAVGTSQAPTRKEGLSLRLAGAEIATGAATLEVKTAGGKGYASGTPASRRFRESAFIPVQSPSEAQLRWELSTCE